MKQFGEVMKRDPLDHQREGILYAWNHHYLVIGDEQGLGKTFQAIAVALMSGGNTLVISPAYLKFNWELEFLKFAKEELFIELPKKLFRGWANIQIINYEMLRKDVAKAAFAWADNVIFDECQYLKNMDAQRTIAAHTLVYDYRPNRVMLLSGTPIENNLSEWFSVLAMCSYNPHMSSGDNVFQKYRNQWQFASHFCNVNEFTVEKGGRRFKVRKYYGTRNLPDLRQLLKGKYIKRWAKDCLDLEPLVRKEIQVAYKRDAGLAAAWDAHVHGKAFDITAKAQSAIAKAPFTIKYVKDLLEAGEGPLVVYTDHIKPSEMIHDALPNSVLVNGNIAIKKRPALFKDFIAGKYDVFVATIGAASTGVNLVNSKNLIFNDLAWKPTSNDQAERRIYRYGQTERCTIHTVLGSKVDQKIVALLTRKLEDIRKGS